MVERARVLGAAFRVAQLVSAARPGVLPATHFRTRGRKLMLVFEHRMVDLVADRVGSRFKQLARLVGRSGSIVRKRGWTRREQGSGLRRWVLRDHLPVQPSRYQNRAGVPPR